MIPLVAAEYMRLDKNDFSEMCVKKSKKKSARNS